MATRKEEFDILMEEYNTAISEAKDESEVKEIDAKYESKIAEAEKLLDSEVVSEIEKS